MTRTHCLPKRNQDSIHFLALGSVNTFEVHIQELINQIPLDGSTVGLQPLLFRLTLDSATEFLFGESVNSMPAPEGSEQQVFASAFDYAQSQTLSRQSPT